MYNTFTIKYYLSQPLQDWPIEEKLDILDSVNRLPPFERRFVAYVMAGYKVRHVGKLMSIRHPERRFKRIVTHLLTSLNENWVVAA